MEKHRIYGANISIHTENVQSFYDKRASLIEQKGWGAVSLGDEDPSIASRMYDYDRDILLPKIGINEKCRVLELGCGMGRWAKIVLPHCDGPGNGLAGHRFPQGDVEGGGKDMWSICEKEHFFSPVSL